MKVAIDSGPLTGGHRVRGVGMHTSELVKALQKKSKSHRKLKVDLVDFNKANLNEYDILHYPYFHPYFLTLPEKKPEAKTVVTVHDLIQLKFPKQFSPGLRGQYRFFRQKLRLKNVDAILTISKASKKDISSRSLATDSVNQLVGGVSGVFRTPKQIQSCLRHT